MLYLRISGMANRSAQGWKQPKFSLDVNWAYAYSLALLSACNNCASKHCIIMSAVPSFLMSTHDLVALDALKLHSTVLFLPLHPKHQTCEVLTRIGRS